MGGRAMSKRQADRVTNMWGAYGFDPPADQPASDRLTMEVTAQHQPRHGCAMWRPIAGSWGEPIYCVTCALAHGGVSRRFRLSPPTCNSHCPLCGGRMT